jgi:hypothetical protein
MSMEKSTIAVFPDFISAFKMTLRRQKRGGAGLRDVS